MQKSWVLQFFLVAVLIGSNMKEQCRKKSGIWRIVLAVSADAQKESRRGQELVTTAAPQQQRCCCEFILRQFFYAWLILCVSTQISFYKVLSTSVHFAKICSVILKAMPLSFHFLQIGPPGCCPHCSSKALLQHSNAGSTLGTSHVILRVFS